MTANCRYYSRRQLAQFGSTGLPAGYRSVEYIQTSKGNAYIDTGIKGKASLKIECDVMPLSRDFKGLFGNTYNKAPNLSVASRANSSNSSFFYYGSAIQACAVLNLNQKYHMLMDKGKLYYNGTLQRSLSWGSYGDSANNILIGKNNRGGISQRFYNFKMWENDVLVRDYVPCINTANKVGMFDRVTGTFYGSASSSNFTYG